MQIKLPKSGISVTYGSILPMSMKIDRVSLGFHKEGLSPFCYFGEYYGFYLSNFAKYILNGHIKIK